MTLRQLRQSTTSGDKRYLDGRELNFVTFVGLVLELNAEATATTFLIDDGTAFTRVRQYVDQEAAVPQPPVQLHSYVRVYGSFRANDSTSMNATRVVPIVDHNEIILHLLQAVSVHLRNTKGHGADHGAGAGAASTSAYGSYGGQLHSGYGGHAHGHAGSELAPSGGAAGGAESEWSRVEQTVLRVVRKYGAQSGEGVSPAEIVQRTAHLFAEHEVRKAVTRLVDQGMFYTTNDDQLNLSDLDVVLPEHGDDV